MIRYAPIRASYLRRYPAYIRTILLSSFECMRSDEVLQYLRLLPPAEAQSVAKRILELSREHAYLSVKLIEWLGPAFDGQINYDEVGY